MTKLEGSVIAKFADLDSANRALRKLRDAQKNEGLDIREGAVVVGTVDGVMPVTNLDEVGLGDVASNAVDLMAYLGVGTAKIAAQTAIAGGLLLMSSARRVAALGGSLLVMPAKKFLNVLGSDQEIDLLGATIEPGTCAVVAVVEDAAAAAQVMAELAESGGLVLELDVDAQD
ncbi:MAG: hypothetical protein ACK2UO_11870 [Caldilineaceae bacterium]